MFVWSLRLWFGQKGRFEVILLWENDKLCQLITPRINLFHHYFPSDFQLLNKIFFNKNKYLVL